MSLKILLYLALATLLLLLTACNKGAQSQATTSGTQTTSAAEPAAPAGDELPSVEGTSLTLASGTALTVEAVADIDKDPAAHSGLIAVEGRVLQVFPEKAAFTMTDYGVEVCLDKPGCTS